MTYVIEGLDPAPYLPLFELGDAELAARGAVRMVADARPGYPCRVSLEDAAPGTRMLLLNHVSRPAQGPYRAAHAIFVGEGAAAPASYVDAVPPVFAPRVLSLRGFDADGMMVNALLAQPGEADAGLRRLFAEPRIVEVDVHNAVRGCFAARTRRMENVSRETF
ncbi:DUF1203 domain-containing protein [Erythrobacter sp. NE805]|uniref:DUF1203 domain-containing protein n=1 Tax=Erythrobacter sp. NE805 TaxID=3389875 RepID=UPI00396B48AB